MPRCRRLPIPWTTPIRLCYHSHVSEKTPGLSATARSLKRLSMPPEPCSGYSLLQGASSTARVRKSERVYTKGSVAWNEPKP
jgi:hypothetical protein